jgi:Tfp pilus assembly protein PilF
MKRTCLVILAAACLALVGPPSARAQLNTASAIRGEVKDESGQPLVGVEVELDFKGESRVKILKKTLTNKKGGYIYSGLPPGPWVFTFRKAGYKTVQVNSSISLGGISEIPPVTMVPGADATAGGDTTGIKAPVAPGQSPDKSKALADKYTQGMTLLKAGSYAEGEALMNEVLAVVPGFAPAHQALATAYATQGNVAAAEASYRKVIEFAPEDASGYLSLANFMAKQNKYEDAFKLLQDASPQFAQNGLMQFALGAAAFNLNKSDEAQAAFLKALEISPANAEPLFYLGSLAVSRNDTKQAIEYLEKYAATAPATAANVPAAKAILDSLKKK